MKKIKKLNIGGHVTKKELEQINQEYQKAYNEADEATKAKMNNMILSGQNYSSADSMNNKSKRDFEYHLKSNILKAVQSENFMLDSPTAPTKNIFNGYSNAESSNLANTLVYRYLNQPTETSQQPSYSTEQPISDSGKRYYDFKFNNPENFSIGGGTFEDRYRNYVNGVIEGLIKAKHEKDNGKIIRGLPIEDIETRISSLQGLLSNIGDRNVALNNLIEVLKPFNIDRDAFLTYFKDFLPEESEAEKNKNDLINKQYKEVDLSDQSDYVKQLIAQNNFKFMKKDNNIYAFDQNYNPITTPFIQINDDFSQEGVEGSSYGHGLLIDANGNVFMGDTSKITAGHRFKQALDDFVTNMNRSGLWLTKTWDFNNSYSDDDLTNKLMWQFKKEKPQLQNVSYTDVGALFEGNTPIIAYDPSGRDFQSSRYGDIKFDANTRFAYLDANGELQSGKTLQEIEQAVGKYNRSGYSGEDNTGTGEGLHTTRGIFDDAETLDMNSVEAFDEGFFHKGITIAQRPDLFVSIVLQALVKPDATLNLSAFDINTNKKGKELLDEYGYYSSNDRKKLILATVGRLVEDGDVELEEPLRSIYTRYVKNKYYSLLKNSSTASQKNGGIIKFEYGGQPLTLSQQSNSKQDSWYDSEGTKRTEKEAEKAKEQGYSSLSQYDAATTTDVKWTTADSFRAAALAQDVAGLIAAISGAATLGAGSVAAEGLGISATVTDLVADIIDPKISAGEVFKNLGINAALSAGAFVGAKTPKIIKSAMKLIPHIVMTIGAAGVALDPEVHQTVKKLVDGKEKLNAKDWNNIYMVLQMSLGLGTGSAQGVASKRANKKLNTVRTTESTLDPNTAYIENPSGGAPIALPKETAAKVKDLLNDGKNTQAKQILSELKKQDTDERLLTDDQITELTNTSRSWRNWFRKTDNFKPEVPEESSVIDYEALQKLIKEEESRVGNSAWQNLLSVGNKTPKTAVELAAMRELGINPLPFPFVKNGRKKLNEKIQAEIDKLPYILDPEVLQTKFDEDLIKSERQSEKRIEAILSLDELRRTKQEKIDAEAEVKRIQEELEGLNIDQARNDYDADRNWLFTQFLDQDKELKTKIRQLEFSMRRQKDGPAKTLKQSELSKLEKELAEIESRAKQLQGKGKASLKQKEKDLASLQESYNLTKEQLDDAKTKASTAKTEYDKIRDDLKLRRNRRANEAEDLLIVDAQNSNNKVKKAATIKDTNGAEVQIKEGSKVISLIGRNVTKGKDYAKRAAGTRAKEIKKEELSKIIKDVSKVEGAYVAENGTLYIYQQGGKTKYSHLRK